MLYFAKSVCAFLLVVLCCSCGEQSKSNPPAAITIQPPEPVPNYQIDIVTSEGGHASTSALNLENAQTASVDFVADSGYQFVTATGCPGSLNGLSFVLSNVTENCTLSATFTRKTFELLINHNAGGTTNAEHLTGLYGDNLEFSVLPDKWFYATDVTGCNVYPQNDAFIVPSISENCSVTVNFAEFSLSLSAKTNNTYVFTWPKINDVSDLSLYEKNSDEGTYQKALTLDNTTTAHSMVKSIFEVDSQTYFVRACIDEDCRDSNEVNLNSVVKNAVGYFKPPTILNTSNFGNNISMSGNANIIVAAALGQHSFSAAPTTDEDRAASLTIFSRNTDMWQQDASFRVIAFGKPGLVDEPWFGEGLSISADGNTIAVSDPHEDSSARGVNPASVATKKSNSGAVYIFTKNNDEWSMSDYLKSSNSDVNDNFGQSVSLSDDGNVLIVGAPYESGAVSTTPDTANTLKNSGAAYLFTKNNSQWIQTAYLKASDAQENDRFGEWVEISANGRVAAVGASYATYPRVFIFENKSGTWQQTAILTPNTYPGSYNSFGSSIDFSEDATVIAIGDISENGASQGINGDESMRGKSGSGAVHIFRLQGETWQKEAYIKASNADVADLFGFDVNLSADGDTLITGSMNESSNAEMLNGNEQNNSLENSGALYVFKRTAGEWQQIHYIKAPNPSDDDYFGRVSAISKDGKSILTSAYGEAGLSPGIGGDIYNTGSSYKGAVYLFE